MDPQQLPLRDLHLPEVIGWWPLAPGWWVVIILAMAGLLYWLRHAYRQRLIGRARRHALKCLDRIEQEFIEHRSAVVLGSELSELLRRAMLAYAPREEIAGLTGDAWLKWLDTGLTMPQFVNGAGRNILELPYRDPEDDYSRVDVNGLITAVRHRLSSPVDGTAAR